MFSIELLSIVELIVVLYLLLIYSDLIWYTVVDILLKD